MRNLKNSPVHPKLRSLLIHPVHGSASHLPLARMRKGLLPQPIKNFPILTNLDESEGLLFKKKRKKVKKMRNSTISSTYKPRPKTTF